MITETHYKADDHKDKMRDIIVGIFNEGRGMIVTTQFNRVGDKAETKVDVYCPYTNKSMLDKTVQALRITAKRLGIKLSK